MNAADLKATLAKHAEWLSDPATGERADLRGANLIGADLSGANLTDALLGYADLTRANLVGTGVRVWQSDFYAAYTVPGQLGRLLAFGCERLKLAAWDRDVAEICQEHEPERAAEYEREIRALVAMCRAIFPDEQEREQGDNQ